MQSFSVWNYLDFVKWWSSKYFLSLRPTYSLKFNKRTPDAHNEIQLKTNDNYLKSLNEVLKLWCPAQNDNPNGQYPSFTSYSRVLLSIHNISIATILFKYRASSIRLSICEWFFCWKYNCAQENYDSLTANVASKLFDIILQKEIVL